MEKLIIFIKNPRLGLVKTRLAESIGNEQALTIYKKLIAKTLKESDLLNCKKDIWFSDSDKVNEEIFVTRKSYALKVQKGSNLGERMKYAFQECFQDGFKKVVIIGSDCPELKSSVIKKAFEQLDTYDVVLGPAKDGGYYLLGMNSLYPKIFTGVNWSTSSVLNQTLKYVNASQLSYNLLEELSDIDTLEDLQEYRVKGNTDL